MEENVISQLSDVPNYSVLLVGVSLGIAVWWIISNWDKLKIPYEWLMSWYNNKKRKEELLQMLLNDHQETIRLAKEVNTFNEKQVEYHEQSIEIRNNLDDKIEKMLNKIEELQKNTNSRFEELEDRNNKRVRAELKDKIGDSYRYYHSKGKINDIELEALEDLIEAYEDAKGENSFVHSLVQKEMYTWEKIDRE